MKGKSVYFRQRIQGVHAYQVTRYFTEDFDYSLSPEVSQMRAVNEAFPD
jgi:hypothetical protein